MTADSKYCPALGHSPFRIKELHPRPLWRFNTKSITDLSLSPSLPHKDCDHPGAPYTNYNLTLPAATFNHSQVTIETKKAKANLNPLVPRVQEIKTRVIPPGEKSLMVDSVVTWRAQARCSHISHCILSIELPVNVYTHALKKINRYLSRLMSTFYCAFP